MERQQLAIGGCRHHGRVEQQQRAAHSTAGVHLPVQLGLCRGNRFIFEERTPLITEQ
jgi:hypothetical protein